MRKIRDGGMVSPFVLLLYFSRIVINIQHFSENLKINVLISRAELVETHPTLKVQALEDMKVSCRYRDT
jgi:hypothetical protein